MRLTVLDLTRLLPGGYATHLLVEMGARVIKIEDPDRGDYMREFPFPLEDGMSAYFHSVNRGKQSVAIDLKKTPEKLLKLSEQADVLIESFRSGVMDRLGAGWEKLRQRNPRLIYCSIAGYSSDGRWAGRAGHDINYVGRTGLLDLNRGQDGLPAMPGLQIADLAAGSMFAVARILQSVLERYETGRGARIELDMVSGTSSLLGFAASPAALAGRPLSWDDLLLNGQVACYNLYPTRDGRWLSMGNLEEKFWRNFCHAAGREDWINEQFNRSPQFRSTVSAFFETNDQSAWMEIFRNVDTCIEPVLTLNEAASLGLFRYPGNPAPRLGEHTKQVLAEFGVE